MREDASVRRWHGGRIVWSYQVRSPEDSCDDGNTRDGDGCSRDCTIEDGFVRRAHVLLRSSLV